MLWVNWGKRSAVWSGLVGDWEAGRINALFAKPGWWLLPLGAVSLLPLVLGDPRGGALALNTLRLCLASAAISVPLGTVLALLLLRTDLPGRRFATLVIGVLLFVPLYLQAAAWQAGFGLQGWFTLAWSGPVWIDGWFGAIWVHAMAALPWVVLVVGLGVWFVEPEFEEAALLDGTPWQVFTRVTLRRSAGAIGVATLLVFVTTAGEMTATDLYRVRTYAEELYTQLAIGGTPGEAALAIAPGIVFTAWLVLAGLVICARLVPTETSPGVRPPWRFQLGAYRWLALAFLLVVLLIAVGVPLGSLLYKAGILVTQADEGRVRSWSPFKCASMVAAAPARSAREFGWSLQLSTLAATAAVGLAIPLAWYARRGAARAWPALFVTALGWAVPGPIVALALIRFFTSSDLLSGLYNDTIAAPWLALTLRALPPAVLVLWHALRTVPVETLEVATLDGAGPVARLLWIALPQRRAALAVAWLAAFALALADLSSSILVVPPGVITLSIEIFQQLHYGAEDRVAAVSLALVISLATVAGAIAWAARYWKPDETG